MLRPFIRPIYTFVAHLGGFGLLALSAVDSSPLFLPFGNDLMLIAMTAKKHELMLYYALMSAIGSTLGCLADDLLSRKEGEKGLEKTLSPKRLQYIRKRIKKGAAWALIVACLVPPPFPFTPFVAGAAALQYPRKKLLSVVSITRFARFAIEGLLAIFFGRRILRLAPLGVPPALPGRQKEFDRSGSPSRKLDAVSRQAHGEEIRDGREQKPKPYEVGVQISCGVHPQVPPEGFV